MAFDVGRFSVRIDSMGSPTVVVPMGDFDEAASRPFESVMDHVAGRRGREVVIDLGEVTFFGAAGVRELIRAQERLRCRGWQLSLRHPSPQARRLLDLSRTSEILLVR